MCPICITTALVNIILWILGALGLKKLYNFIKKRYYIWSGKKCSKCKSKEEKECQSQH
jgi:hypothetical protein